MTAKELATALTGREAGKEFFPGEERDAKDAGLAAVYGYFDDNVEFCGAINDDPATIGQYTGLTDKNGVKIFVWDIVCNNEPEDVEMKPLPVFGAVKFGEYDGDLPSLEYQTTSDHVGFFVDWKDNEDGEYSEDFRRDLGYWVKYPNFEVCGNIHDNPELLEATPLK